MSFKRLPIVAFAILTMAILPYGTAQANEAAASLRLAAQLQRNGETGAALAIWTRWAERGDADAAYNLAVVHQHGDGIAVDFQQALRWYRIAAARGDRVAEYQLGLMYLTGQGVTVDEAEAHRWFIRNRQHHAHHAHTPQMQTWRAQAAALIQESDRRESLAAARASAAQVMADLRQRAGQFAPTALAAVSPGSQAQAHPRAGREPQ